MLALPWVLLVHIMFTLGISLLLAMGNLFYRDVKYLFEIVLTIWMFLSAVLYPVEPGRRHDRADHGAQPDDADSRRLPRCAAARTTCRIRHRS